MQAGSPTPAQHSRDASEPRFPHSDAPRSPPQGPESVMEAPRPSSAPAAAAPVPGQTVTTGLPPTAPAHAFDDMEEPLEVSSS